MPPATVQHRLELSAPGPLVPPDVARRVVRRLLLSRARGGTLVIVDPEGRTAYGDGDGPTSELTVTDPRAWSLALQRGSVGLGEAYVDALFDTDDLVGVLRLLARNLGGLNALGNRLAPLVNLLARRRDRTTRPTKDDARTNVVAHYDVGDDFFELFLDPTMAYSCGVFDTSSCTLEDASTAKFDRICAKLELGAADHVVEIGTGWGGFAIHAASRYGCRVTTTTISAHQYAAARRRVAAAHLEGLVTVCNRDYRDLEGRYSHLVSIEMIEAVDWRDYDAYFGAIDRLVAQGGMAALQCILIGDARLRAGQAPRRLPHPLRLPRGVPAVEGRDRRLAREGDHAALRGRRRPRRPLRPHAAGVAPPPRGAQRRGARARLRRAVLAPVAVLPLLLRGRLRRGPRHRRPARLGATVLRPAGVPAARRLGHRQRCHTQAPSRSRGAPSTEVSHRATRAGGRATTEVLGPRATGTTT